MKYLPKPIQAIIQAIEMEAVEKKSLIIQLKEEVKQHFAIVVESSEDLRPFLQSGDKILYNKYSAVSLDQNDLYAIGLEGIICRVEE